MGDIHDYLIYMYVHCTDILQFPQNEISQNYSMAVNQYCDTKERKYLLRGQIC